MKKLFAILLVILTLLLFAACGNDKNDEKTIPTNSSSDASAASSDKADSSNEANDSEKPKNDDSSDFSNSSDKNSSDQSSASNDIENEAEADKAVVRLATTNTLNDSGLLDYLLSKFEKESGYKVEVSASAVGVVIGCAKIGEADLILVNSKSQQEDFISSGYASGERIMFIDNHYIICGPKDDPAEIADKANINEALKAIAQTKADYVSRGDNSSTNKVEMSFWEAAGINPKNESWYSSVNSDMKAALKEANSKKAYVFSDMATYCSMKKSLKKLKVVMSDPENLKDTYSLIAVRADATAFKNTDIKINEKGAKTLIDWLVSKETSNLISEYGVKEYGEALFAPVNK